MRQSATSQSSVRQGLGRGVNPVIARLKAAAAAAPATLAAIPKAVVAFTYSGENNPPYDIGGDYQRFWLTGAGTQGSATLRTVSKMRNAANIGPVVGATYQSQDGSRAEWNRQGTNLPDKAGDNSGHYYGLRLRNASMLAFTTRLFCYGTVRINGAVSATPWKTSVSGYVYVPLGTVRGDFDVVIEGGADTWLSEIVIEEGATVEPFDWMVDKLTVGHHGDSYSQGVALVNGFRMPHQRGVAELIGGGFSGGTAWGGTGYSADNQNVNTPNAIFPARITAVTSHAPDVDFIDLGINDGWPTSPTIDQSNPSGPRIQVDTALAMQTLYETMRASSPNMMIVVVTPMAPKESDGANPAGRFQAMRAKILELLAALPGPWIMLDALQGGFYTSAGTQSSVWTGSWITGNGNSGAPTGIGNADTVIGPDGTHPTEDIGHPYLIAKKAETYRAALATM